MVSKQAISYYHSYALNRDPSNELLFKWKKCASPLCRHGCGVVETIAHIFIECGQNDGLRGNLLSIINEHKLVFDVKTIFGDLRLKEATERFIYEFLKLKVK